MIPKAKKNLHQCEYHLNSMKRAGNAEEFEIAYCAFVMSARTVTFVLQKEFSKNKDFEIWYQKKQDEMKNNSISKFFLDQRNSIEKEGVNALVFSLNIDSLNLTGNEDDIPLNSEIEFESNGTFFRVHKGTSKEDLIPARLKGSISVKISIQFDGKDKNVMELCGKHYLFLKELVEDWTGKVNEVKFLIEI